MNYKNGGNMGNIHGGEYLEEEWFSICCYAPPLYDLHIDDGIKPAGLCMKCRDNTTFELGKEE